MKIFFKADLSLDELAVAIRKVLNIPPTNRSQIVQAREGENIGGGLYYYFEVLGLKLYLIQNAGVVIYPEKKEFRFYLYAENHDGLHENLNEVTRYIAQVLKEESFEVEIDETED